MINAEVLCLGRTSLSRGLWFRSLWQRCWLISDPFCIFAGRSGARGRGAVLRQDDVERSLRVERTSHGCLGQHRVWDGISQHSPHVIQTGIELGYRTRHLLDKETVS